MKKREFNSILKAFCTKGVLDPVKIAAMDDEACKRIVLYLLQKRAPIVMDFIRDSLKSEIKFACFGYQYVVQGKFFKFLCSMENASKVDAKWLDKYSKAFPACCD